MGIRSLRSISLTSAAITALAAGTAAVAQENVQAQPGEAKGRVAMAANTVEELVVTARKQAENIQRVPLSITAETGAKLKAQSINTVADLQQQVPSLFIEPAYDDPNSIVVTLRGRKQDDATLVSDASIAVTVDGLYVPRTLGMQGELLDISRVEVLRGPQGTLYGRNSTGGGISLYTNDPTDRLEGSIDVTGGNYGAWDVVGIANVPIEGDKLDARFVFENGGHGGYATNTTGGALDWSRKQYYRAKIRWVMNDKWYAVLSGHYETASGGAFIQDISGLTPANFQNNGLPEGGLLALELQAQSGLPIDQAVSQLESYVGGYRLQTIDNTKDLPPALNETPSGTHTERWDVALNIYGDLADGLKFRSITGFQHLIRGELTTTQTAVEPFISTYHTTDNYVSQEFQLLGNMHSVNWVAGVYAAQETGKDYTSVIILPALLGPNVNISNTDIHNDTLAVFGQAVWEFVPGWRLTGGARFTYDTRAIYPNDFISPFYYDEPAAETAQYCVVPAPGVESSVTAAQCPGSFRNTFTKPTWLVSLDHQLTQGVLVYGKVATGYRSGGQNEGGAIERETFATVRPENNLEYELGFKSDWLDHRVRFNLDGYWDNYTNLQVTSRLFFADGNFGTIITNAATARIRGIEAEGDFDLIPNLSLHGGLAYTDAHYIHFVDITGDRSHQPFDVPRYTVALDGTYVVPTSWGKLSLELDYDWKSKTIIDGSGALTDQETQPAYGLLNGRVNLHLDKWDADIALFGKNMTNVDYWVQGIQLEALGFNLTIKGEPATYGVEIIKHF